MKNRLIMLCSIILLITLVLLINNKNTTFDSSNVVAITLDGESISNFPDYSSGKYKANVNCENASGSFLPVKESDGDYNLKLVLEDIEGKTSCTLDFKTISESDKLTKHIEDKANNSAFLNTKAFGSTTIDGVDYDIGFRSNHNASDSYIEFNGELWRIIGAIDTMTADGELKKLTKIMRNEPLGFGPVDGDWVNSKVNHLLNDYYLNGLDATNTDYCVDSSGVLLNCNYTRSGIKLGSYYGQMLENVVWYLGGMSSTSADENYYKEAYTSEWFTYERKGLVYGDYAKSTTGYVGIVSASDYGYASHYYSSYKLNYLIGDSYNFVRGLGDILLMNHNTATGGAFVLSNEGDNNVSTTTSGHYAIYPVVYLSEDVYVIDGNGGSGNPYIIGM